MVQKKSEFPGGPSALVDHTVFVTLLHLDVTHSVPDVHAINSGGGYKIDTRIALEQPETYYEGSNTERRRKTK